MKKIRAFHGLTIGLLGGLVAAQASAFSGQAADTLPSKHSAAALVNSVPADGGSDVSLDTPLELHFREPLAEESVNASTVSLLGPNGTLPIVVGLDSTAQTVRVRTQRELLPASRYTVFVSGARFANNAAIPLTALTFKTQSIGVSDASKASMAPLEAVNDSEVNETEILTSTASFARRARRLVAGDASSANVSASNCDNQDVFRGYSFCRKKADISGGIFRPGFENTDARWRVNTPLPRLPATSDFPAGTFPKGQTAVFGVVRRIDDEPVAKVTLSMGAVSTQTDAQGRFALIGIPNGQQVLVVDGRTANRASEEYGQFTASLEVKANEANSVPYNLFLPRIDARDKIHIPSPTTEDLVITHPSIPGMSIQIPAGTVLRNREGHIITEFAVVPMPVDRSPIPAPANFPVYVSMQPGDATVESLTETGATGLRVIYPNYTLENTKEQGFWYYDTDRGEWQVYASGRVSDDGRTVIPLSLHGASVLMPQGGASIGGLDPPPPVRCSSGGTGDGDPVDCATGAFVHFSTDLAVNDTPPLAFTRMYSSQDPVSRQFGRGMTNNYAMYVHVPEGSCYGIYTSVGTEIDLVTGDGAVYPFFLISGATRNTGVLVHNSTPTRFYGAIMQTDNHNDLTVTLTDGTVYRISTGCPTLLKSVSDRFGNTSTLTYNAGLLSQIASSSGRWLSFTYNSNNQISAVSDNSGRGVNYAYDSAKRLITTTFADGTTERYTYDAANNMRTVVDRRGMTMVTNAYDGNQRVSQQTYADGSTYQFAYTLSGSTVTATDVTDGRGNVKHLAFDAAGYPVSVTRASGTAQAQTTTYTRNAGELVTSVVDPLGRTTTLTYNDAGDVLTRMFLAGTPEAATYSYTYTSDSHQVASVTDPLGNSAAYAYTQGCLTSATDPLGHTTTITCDSSGKPVSVVDALGHRTTLNYVGNDLQSITDPLNRTTELTLDNLGRTIAVRDPSDRLTRVSYDSSDRVTQSVDALGQATAYAYDDKGNLLSVTDPDGGVTQYGYDERNRPTSRTDALTHAESWTYDAQGNVDSYTDRKGQVAHIQYDALNRPTQITDADGHTTTASYDAGNRLITVADSQSGAITRSYDGQDRLITEQTPQGTVSYQYDVNGRRTQMTAASQSPVGYSYDAAGRLTAITQAAETVSLDYDTANRRTTVKLPNGLQVGYTYDAADQLTGLSYATASGMTLGTLSYGYDVLGRRISQGGSWASETLATPTSAVSAFNLNNQQTQFNGAAWTYDLNGDPTSGADQTYVFDARQQLQQILEGAIPIASFQYDAFGRRTGKTINGVTTSYLYDGGNAVQEMQGAAVSPILTGLNIDERFARTEAAGRRYFLTDALGSTIALADASQAIQQTYQYEPYGEVNATGSSDNPYQYTGRENDGTGLYYYRARYYSPTLKRFISEDPVGLAAGLNSYAYVHGDPTNRYDPLGLDDTQCMFDPQSCGGAGGGSWSFGDPLPQPYVDFFTGFGDAFLIPIVVRWSFNIGGVNKCSSYYSAGEAAGVIWGLVPFALEDAAAWGGTKVGHVLNHNRYFRIGPGRVGKDMLPRISSPYLPGNGHFELISRLTKIPPLGPLLDQDCSCGDQ
jgi:RHS repeat-associated protein